MAKLDKYDILADAVRALRDQNNKILVETVMARLDGNGTARSDLQDRQSAYTPLPRNKNHMAGVFSDNSRYADSIKIGKDISMRRMYNEPTHVKTDKGEYDVDNGFYYIVRTPRGEAKFDENDRDFGKVWGHALSVYDGWYDGLKFFKEWEHRKLEAAALKPGVAKDKTSKYDRAIKNVEKLGAKPNKVLDYIKSKQKQNG